MPRHCRHCHQSLPKLKECETPYQRSGFCGGCCYAAYAQSKAVEQRQKPKKARAPIKRRTKRKPRQGDNSAYLDWVKRQPCVICQQQADDAHHIIGEGFSGMGMTAPDLLSMPVCREHHDEIHRRPELWECQYRWLVKTIDRAISEGVLNV